MNSQSRMYDVGGVLMARPFKARRLGHFALWQTDLEMARHLYVDVLGFRHTDTVERANWQSNGFVLGRYICPGRSVSQPPVGM